MTTSRGVARTDTAFLALNSVELPVRSANMPRVKDRSDADKPIMVKNWKCQPYATENGVSQIVKK